MIKEIEHFSGSSMNSFENDIHAFYTRYVLGEEPVYCENVRNAMEFWKEYEVMLSKWKYFGYDTQKECELIIWGYKLYGLFDFYWEEKKHVVECKTKSGWWSDDEVHKSWQFRFYNHWCKKNGFRFSLHQFNKKEKESDERDIFFMDKTFEQDFINKAKQIERFLKQFNVWVKHYNDI